MIRVTDLTKVFHGGEADVTALSGINLTVGQGDIFGIIGMSGAGKSTLLRCIALLEMPTEGKIEVEGVDISKLQGKELTRLRKSIGVIFQGYNLLMQRNVLHNVCFPLELDGMKKAEREKRAMELLEIVGLADKAKAYPSQLSGGQKQRVAIARALANNPKILLCDEPTSALDSFTTKSILNLLQDINCKLGVTIIIITHEIGVVNAIVGQRRYTITLNGESNHAGTTPMGYRRDTVHAFSRICCESIAKAKAHGDPLVLTFGKVDPQPNTVNVVPGKTVFTMDCRHTDARELTAFTEVIEADMRRICREMEIPTQSNRVDIGVRVELPAVVFSHLTDELYESKIVYRTQKYEDKVRTFCMNPKGAVVNENTNGIITVNGHSYEDPAKQTENTNFALLVAKHFSEPFKDSNGYGESIARLSNMLGGGVIVQRFGDLVRGRRSTVKRIEEGLVTPTLAATPSAGGVKRSPLFNTV